jgi:aryl-alcohol dehydrogenase-like predicted oxidoreductase
METRRLGQSGLRLSEIGLGCGSPTFAGRADEQTSIRMIKEALELGINYVDTAETYAEGRSEELVGKAIRGKRSSVVIGTKFGHLRSVGPEMQRGSRSNVLKRVEGSLKRLGTDYIDIYYMHYPDPETPIEETLLALDGLVRAGKVRYIGCSNFTAWQICQARSASGTHHLESFIVAGAEYNLIDRGIERELVPCCQDLGIGIVPTFPLASGFLTGKYRRGQDMPAVSRFASVPRFANAKFQDLNRYRDILTDTNFAKLERWESFAKDRGHAVGDLAIAWLLAHPWLSCVIAGATNEEQIAANVSAANWKLTPGDLAQLDKLD